ncbi:glycerophosphodiester phosphodiesterase [Vibrio rumoiensis]|uniref:Glycerophosphodiester phosphodiesterase n=1 Tax=Vibrio rumoiensis 1S-45 TaxID=1188252 RepID=A0A1E5DYT9_9VIBR|nr:glycerophosphodiester phosphodiesterase family protein [Vibrio rumoiensis]OEF22750.1 glycerophosphodiester phosphodiesterase [Vibrio rumoiensis 1S-45]
MLIIAHRGARSTHPENTLIAIQAAIDMGVQAIEIDVHEHDGQFWVIHDKWLNRTTDHIGKLHWLSAEKLKQVKIAKTENIPTLIEVLKLVDGQCALNIELKGISHHDLLYQHLNFALENCHFQLEQLIVSSFNHDWLKQLKEEQSQWLIGALSASKGTDKASFANKIGATSINLDLDVIDEEYVQHAKQLGLAVYVYTVNQPEDWQWLNEIGVDGVFCDCPAKAIEHYPQPTQFMWQ